MRESYLKNIFISIIVILMLIAIYICVFKEGDRTLISGKTKANNKSITIADDIRIGIIDFDTINPIFSNNRNVQEVSRLIFEPLFSLTEDYKLEGILAKECSKISDKTYIIKLNENILWHDGNKFDSSDVIFTINMLKELKDNSIYYSNVENIISVDKIDEYTIKVILDNENYFFEYNLIFPIISSKYFNKENLKLESKNIKPVGTGMYYISNVNNESILLRKNTEKNDIDKLEIETITLKKYTSLSKEIEAFKLEEIDIFTTSNLDIEEYFKNSRYSISKYINRQYNYLALNCNSTILSNKEVRQAISYAINKEEILESLFNNKYKKSNFPLDFGSYAYDVEDELINYDINKAKSILQESGWKYSEEGWTKKVDNNNLKIEFNIVINKNNQDGLRVGNKIKEQLSAVGILLNIIEASNEEYNNYLKNKNYDIIFVNSTYGYSPSLEKYFGLNNFSNYNNKEIDSILKQEDIFNYDKEIKEKYKRIIEIYKEDMPYISLYYNTNSMIYSSNLKGNIRPNSYNLFYGIENWYREYEK